MRPVVAAALLLLAACRGEAPDPSDPQGRTPSEIEAARAECVAAGGKYTSGGRGGLTCIMPTSDAGKACSRATDCEGFCLAETGTCAPRRPMFGCFPILDAEGQRVEICID